MRGSWCCAFLASPPAAKCWIPCGRSFVAIGGKHILAGDTSYSRAPNATAKRAFCTLGTRTASGFSVAANALASPISRQWATDGTARRVVSRSCVLGSNEARAAPRRLSREVCMSGRTSVSWGCLPIMRRCESRGRVTPKNTHQISIALICGGNAEIGRVNRKRVRSTDTSAPPSPSTSQTAMLAVRRYGRSQRAPNGHLGCTTLRC